MSRPTMLTTLRYWWSSWYNGGETRKQELLEPIMLHLALHAKFVFRL